MTICNNQLYAVDEAAAKVSVFNLDGATFGAASYVTRWGATFGQSSADFKGPAGIDCGPNGRVYIADSGNDRIQVFNTTATKLFESVAPAVPTVSSPAQSAVLPLNSVTLTGTATDTGTNASGVGNVEISVQDYKTGKWWDSTDSSWETDKTYSMASYVASDGTGDQRHLAVRLPERLAAGPVPRRDPHPGRCRQRQPAGDPVVRDDRCHGSAAAAADHGGQRPTRRNAELPGAASGSGSEPAPRASSTSRATRPTTSA